MSATFTIVVRETLTFEIDVEADSERKALAIVRSDLDTPGREAAIGPASDRETIGKSFRIKRP